jgi:hypothetical protein
VSFEWSSFFFPNLKLHNKDRFCFVEGMSICIKYSLSSEWHFYICSNRRLASVLTKKIVTYLEFILQHIWEKWSQKKEKGKQNCLWSSWEGGRKNLCMVLFQEFKEISFSNNTVRII